MSVTDNGPVRGRLTTMQAAMVVARRDFTAILLSRSFLFFLLGPLFTMLIGSLAGGIGQSVQMQAMRSNLGIAMETADLDRMVAARTALDPVLGATMPEFKVVRRLAPGEWFDPAAALRAKDSDLAAILSGSPEHPVLTGTEGRLDGWQGPVALVAAKALGRGPDLLPGVSVVGVATSRAAQHSDRLLTAQMAQVVLLMLTMLLAGMVLSNLVEEKANKVIEVLAAAIPMDALFYGKLFAMLAVSFVGITVWGLAGTAIAMAAGHAMPAFAAPAVGWPMFLLLGVIQFSVGYLLIGSVFLAIGSMAATVRDVQSLSLPATLMQLMMFFIASFAVGKPGSTMELVACVFPFSSPFAMLARAAQFPDLWPQLAAIVWELAWVVVLVRTGSRLFRSRVMKSGGAGGGAGKRGWLRRKRAAT